MSNHRRNRLSNGRYIRLVLAMILIIGLQVLLTSRPVLAHVELIRSEPADSEVLATAPQEMQLWFSEPIVTRFSSVHLLDEQDQPILGASIRNDLTEPDVLHVMAPPLKPGAYTLLWKALAESDGHFSQGFVVFSVGKTQLRRIN